MASGVAGRSSVEMSVDNFLEDVDRSCPRFARYCRKRPDASLAPHVGDLGADDAAPAANSKLFGRALTTTCLFTVNTFSPTTMFAGRYDELGLV